MVLGETEPAALRDQEDEEDRSPALSSPESRREEAAWETAGFSQTPLDRSGALGGCRGAFNADSRAHNGLGTKGSASRGFCFPQIARSVYPAGCETGLCRCRRRDPEAIVEEDRDVKPEKSYSEDRDRRAALGQAAQVR